MTICLVVYKIDPALGSENAMGYHLARDILARYPDAVIITRRNNIPALADDPAFATARLIGIDVPRPLAFFKKGSRGIILYYYLWQFFVGRHIRQLDRKWRFSIIHQLNFHADWAPHFITSPQARILWGPLMHHARVPISWLGGLPWRYVVREWLVTGAKQIFWRNPFLRHAIRRSHHIFFANPAMPRVYHQARDKISLTPLAGCHWPITNMPRDTGRFHLLFVGRLVPLKGPHLVLDSLDDLLRQLPLQDRQRISLTMIGDGPLRQTLLRTIARLNHVYGCSITLKSWLERDDLVPYYQQADYLVFPSLEAQGLVVGEALSQACPVITFDQTGPAFVTQCPDLTVAAPHADYAACRTALASMMQRLYLCPQDASNLRQQAVLRARDLQWPVIAQNLLVQYDGPHDRQR